jgi:hypothetical protein
MKKYLLIIFLLTAFLLCPMNLNAWDGYDFDNEEYIEIPDKESVNPGKDIEIYDYSDESYHDVNVISVKRNGAVMIKVFDYDTGDYRMFEMEDERWPLGTS